MWGSLQFFYVVMTFFDGQNQLEKDSRSLISSINILCHDVSKMRVKFQFSILIDANKFHHYTNKYAPFQKLTNLILLEYEALLSAWFILQRVDDIYLDYF